VLHNRIGEAKRLALVCSIPVKSAATDPSLSVTFGVGTPWSVMTTIENFADSRRRRRPTSSDSAYPVQVDPIALCTGRFPTPPIVWG
jgi:hypothetical protein